MPVALVLVAALLATLAVLPTTRGQLAVSVTREDTPYLAIYFTDPPTARRCTVTDGVQSIAVTTDNQLAGLPPLTVVVSARGPRGGLVDRAEVEVPGVKGRSSLVVGLRVGAAPPRRVDVRVEGQTERLRLLCDGAER